MTVVVKLLCIARVKNWHTQGRTYNFKFCPDQDDADGYMVDDEGDRHYINFPGSAADRASIWKAMDHFQIDRVEQENDYRAL
jgi:hypothetical protein